MTEDLLCAIADGREPRTGSDLQYSKRCQFYAPEFVGRACVVIDSDCLLEARLQGT